MTPTQHLETFDEKYSWLKDIKIQPNYRQDAFKAEIIAEHYNKATSDLKQHIIKVVIAVLEDSIKSMNEQNNLIMTCALSDGNEGIEWSINNLTQTLSTWKELLEE